MTAEAGGPARGPSPSPPRTAAGARRRDLPEFARPTSTPELLRAAILRDGCMLVRGLVDRERALTWRGTSTARSPSASANGAPAAPRRGVLRGVRASDGPNAAASCRCVAGSRPAAGVLAADAPRLAFEMFEIFRQAGLRDAIGGYLGERPADLGRRSARCARRSPASPAPGTRTAPSWATCARSTSGSSLSRCGDEAPGLDIVPRRLDELVPTGGDEAMFDNQISQAKAEEAAGELGIVRPIFEPGDALLFDELFLHRRRPIPSMPKPRFAIESWFFAPSAVPRGLRSAGLLTEGRSRGDAPIVHTCRNEGNTMIAFGFSITEPEVYERCAEPGIRLGAEPDSEILAHGSSRLGLPQLQHADGPGREAGRPRGAGPDPPGRRDHRPRLPGEDPRGAQRPGGRRSSAAPARSACATSPGGTARSPGPRSPTATRSWAAARSRRSPGRPRRRPTYARDRRGRDRRRLRDGAHAVGDARTPLRRVARAGDPRLRLRLLPAGARGGQEGGDRRPQGRPPPRAEADPRRRELDRGPHQGGREVGRPHAAASARRATRRTGRPAPGAPRPRHRPSG